MKRNKVNLNLDKKFPFEVYKIENDINHNPDLHQHKELELDCIVAGKGRCIIGEREYDMEPGDVFLINNMEYHMSIFDADFRMLVFHFDPMFIFEGNDFDYNYLRPYFNRDISISNKIESQNPMAEKIMECVLEIEQEWDEKKEGHRMIIKALLMKLLAILYRSFKSNNVTLDTDNKALDRLRPVINHISENFDRKILLEEAATLIYMNKTYFSGFFKQVMGVNFSDYLERFRVDKAVGLLLAKDLSVSQIATMTGFANASHFIRVFKKHKGTSPKEYKQNIVT